MNRIEKNARLLLSLNIFSFLSILFLGGCALGPDFQPPSSPRTVAYTESPFSKKELSEQTFLWGGQLKAQWWELFEAPSLNRLIERALVHNSTLQAAEASLRQAQENLNAERGSLFPSFDLEGKVQRQRASLAPGTKPSLYNLYHTSVNVSYTLDFFGGIRRQIEALKAQAEYQRFVWEGVYLTLTSNIVSSALKEAALREQIDATHEIVKFQEEHLKIAMSQFRLGSLSKGDLLAQEALLAQTRASLSLLYNDLAQTRHALYVLMGSLPSEGNLPQFRLKEIKLPRKLPVTLPSTLVRQRPDIRASEALLHQASAGIGVAKAQLFPQITLTGNLSSEAMTPQKLFGSSSNIWGIGSQLLQPLFRGGALKAKEKAAQAAYDEAFAYYRHTVLQAFQNVADALHALVENTQAFTHQKQAEKAAYESLLLLQKQFKLGAVSLSRVLVAEQNYQQIKLNRIQAEATRYADTVALFQALGGGWWKRKTNRT